jgi:hypothetical protein
MEGLRRQESKEGNDFRSGGVYPQVSAAYSAPAVCEDSTLWIAK